MQKGKGCLRIGRSIHVDRAVLRRAASLLEQEATVVRECHTVGGTDHWTGEEAAQATYEYFLAMADQLRDIAKRRFRGWREERGMRLPRRIAP